MMKENRKLDGASEEEAKARSTWSRGWREDQMEKRMLERRTDEGLI